METETDSTKVPKGALVEHVIHLAEEFGEWEDHASVSPERGVDVDLDWSVHDVDDWTVDVDDGGFELTGFCDGEYAVQTARARRNPPGKAHPAEYETRTREVAVEIRVDTENPPTGIWDCHVRAEVV